MEMRGNISWVRQVTLENVSYFHDAASCSSSVWGRNEGVRVRSDAPPSTVRVQSSAGLHIAMVQVQPSCAE